MAADNARIGIARAAFFPKLSLTGALCYESSSLSELGKWSSRTFTRTCRWYYFVVTFI